MPARVSFTVKRDFPFPADDVFRELVDWRGHAEWVPVTTVELLVGDGGIGTEFIATSGIGPAALPDRMRVVGLDSDARTVDIIKLGPVITGTVRLQVRSSGGDSCTLEWREDVDVPRVPGVMNGLLGIGSRVAFRQALGRLEKRLRRAS